MTNPAQSTSKPSPAPTLDSLVAAPLSLASQIDSAIDSWIAGRVGGGNPTAMIRSEKHGEFRIVIEPNAKMSTEWKRVGLMRGGGSGIKGPK